MAGWDADEVRAERRSKRGLARTRQRATRSERRAQSARRATRDRRRVGLAVCLSLAILGGAAPALAADPNPPQALGADSQGPGGSEDSLAREIELLQALGYAAGTEQAGDRSGVVRFDPTRSPLAIGSSHQTASE